MNDTEKLLTKAELLEGKNRREKIYIEKLGGSVEIRPLTDLEWTKIQAANSRGMKLVRKKDKDGRELPEFEVNFDPEQSAEATHEAHRMVVAAGVCNIKLTIEDARRLEAGVTPIISNAVLKLTGVSFRPKFMVKKPKQKDKSENKEEETAEKVKSFRKKS